MTDLNNGLIQEAQAAGLMEKKTDIKSLSRAELEEYIVSLGEKKYRADQIFAWLHAKRISDFAQATDLSKALIAVLGADTYLTKLNIKKTQISKEDGTRKYLFECADKSFIESVFMSYTFGNSVCVSSQVGCAMGCKFCASTADGVKRNLSASEMLEQVYEISTLPETGVSRVVVMGSGEPFINYENLKRFIYIISDEKGMNIGRRHITVSTCGIIERIRDAAKDFPQVNLALSLHSAIQEKRETLMPVAKKYHVKDVMNACKRHTAITGRRLTVEYALIEGVNDTDEDTAALKSLLHGVPCTLNLIRVNPVRGGSFKEPKEAAVQNFKRKLENMGINVTIRREMGRDIDGACGQLAGRYRV